MDPGTIEIVQFLSQVAGAPVAVGFVLYWVWTHGPKQDIERVSDKLDEDLERMNRSMDGIRSDLSTILAEQQRHRDRLQWLEYQAGVDRKGR